MTISNLSETDQLREQYSQNTTMSEGTRRIVERYVQEYNDARRQSRIAYVIPKDWLARCEQAVGLQLFGADTCIRPGTNPDGSRLSPG